MGRFDGKNTATLQKSHSATVAFSPNGKILASGSDDGIKLWDVATGKNTATLRQGTRVWGVSIAFSPDGKTLAIGMGGIELWDVETKRRIATRHGHGSGPSVMFSPDGKTLASGSRDGTALLWNVSELIDN